MPLRRTILINMYNNKGQIRDAWPCAKCKGKSSPLAPSWSPWRWSEGNCIKWVFRENWFPVREKVFGKSYSLENSLRESIFREDLFLCNWSLGGGRPLLSDGLAVLARLVPLNLGVGKWAFGMRFWVFEASFGDLKVTFSHIEALKLFGWLLKPLMVI